MIMETKTNITDFSFLPSGHGAYKVAYQSPVTGKTWTARITDMELIDATKNADSPKKVDLDTLKRTIKRLND